MRPLAVLTALALATLSLVPPALAGSADAPEVTDAAGDCAFAPGNEYMDVVAAWISDETATDFQVHLALNKWTEPVGHGSGFAVQFEHQGKQWGTLAFFDAAMGEWYFSTGYAGEDGVGGFNDTEGSFAAGAPAVISWTFPKDLFPHTDASDNALRAFSAGSVDMKLQYPLFFLYATPAPPPDDAFSTVPAIDCDDAESDAVYTFGSGQHSGHAGMDMGDASTNGTASSVPADANATDDAELAQAVTPAGGDDANGTPAPGALALGGALAAAAVVATRRRR